MAMEAEKTIAETSQDVKNKRRLDESSELSVEGAVKLGKNERIEALGDGLQVVQRPDYFCFGVDAVLLANFTKMKKGARVAEFCSGNAVVSILLTQKESASSIVAFEFQPELFKLAEKSLVLSGLTETVRLVCDDVLNARAYIEKESLDTIVVNPPYVKRGGGLLCGNRQRTLARQESTLGLEELFRVSKELLKEGGELFMVHRPDRLVDIFSAGRFYGLEPKVLTMVHPNVGKPANIVLVKCKKGAGEELMLNPPVFLYDENGQSTGAASTVR